MLPFATSTQHRTIPAVHCLSCMMTVNQPCQVAQSCLKVLAPIPLAVSLRTRKSANKIINLRRILTARAAPSRNKPFQVIQSCIKIPAPIPLALKHQSGVFTRNDSSNYHMLVSTQQSTEFWLLWRSLFRSYHRQYIHWAVIIHPHKRYLVPSGQIVGICFVRDTCS